MKTILLADMDAFFASVEQRCNPALRGKPICVTGPAHRSVITTASYEARRFGVKTGMSIREAKALCPQLILVTGDNDKYTHICTALKEVYLSFTPVVEVYSIDEAFLDITGSSHLFGGPIETGRRLKAEIRRRFGISATIGIGPNRLLAKLASDISKPDGLRLIEASEAGPLLKDLPPEKLWGIGAKTAEKLKRLGIRTCGELASAPAGLLRSCFGVMGERLRALGMGVDSTPLHADQEDEGGPGGTKSIGHSTTLPHDLFRRSEMAHWLLRLSEKVGSRARRHGLTGRTVTLIMRYRSFETFERRRGLGAATNDTHTIFRTAMDILSSTRLKEPVRLLGVTLCGIEQADTQLALFGGEDRRAGLLRVMDMLNMKYGPSTLTWAACKGESPHRGIISPAWRPSGAHRSL